jgi:hypothetical protein
MPSALVKKLASRQVALLRSSSRWKSLAVSKLPDGAQCQYETKVDGFRAENASRAKDDARLE